jgi:hypothetical protein
MEYTKDRNQKISNLRKGMKFSDETRKKLSIAHKGKMPSNIAELTKPENIKRAVALAVAKTKGVPLSIEKRIKISNSLKGSKSYLWKGGLTNINLAIRNGIEYRLWRESVFKRDNYTCVWCGLKNGMGKTIILHPDHIKPFALYPELRFAIDNGRTLCIDCHKKTDTYGGKMNNYSTMYKTNEIK